MTSRHGMTLVEIVMTLGIIAISLLVVAVLIPRVIRSQETNRFRVYACAKALDAMWVFNNLPTPDLVDGESTAGAWDVPVGYRTYSHDAEIRLNSMAGGFAPVPIEIARRLDSDDDEIQRLLDEGGQVFYQLSGKAIGLSGFRTGVLREPQETARLVFGVVGYAQHNAMPAFPWKAWPYHAMYPFPPQPDWANFDQNACYLNQSVDTLAGSGWVNSPRNYERAMSPEPAQWDRVCAAHGRMVVKLNQYNGSPDNPTSGDDLLERMLTQRLGGIGVTDLPSARLLMQSCAKGYVEEAMAYADAVQPGLAAAQHAGTATLTGGNQVMAASYLAHAAATLTRWFTAAELASVSVGGLTWNVDAIKNAHRTCLDLAMGLAASDPYDWRAPRPLNRAIAWDVPLLEWDLFSPPTSGSIAGLSGALAAAEQWKPIHAASLGGAPVTVRGTQVNQDHPDVPLAITWGSTANFTLTRRFDPSERCRQLVVWAVDWQRYDDVETAPSAPVDASRYPVAAPQAGLTSFEDRMGRKGVNALGGDASRGLFFNANYHFLARNPEKEAAFVRDVSLQQSGADMTRYIQGRDYPDQGTGAYVTTDFEGYALNWTGGEFLARDQGLNQPSDRPLHARPPLVFSGRFGADRNGDLTLTRGPVRREVRMRATTLTRVNFYDPRLPHIIR